MSKVTSSADFDRVKAEDLAKFLAIFGDDLLSVINGNLDFSNNFNCKLVSVTFGAANTDVSVSHGLDRVPIGYLVYSQSAAMAVYDGATANTSTTLYLRSSATGSAGVIVF